MCSLNWQDGPSGPEVRASLLLSPLAPPTKPAYPPQLDSTWVCRGFETSRRVAQTSFALELLTSLTRPAPHSLSSQLDSSSDIFRARYLHVLCSVDVTGFCELSAFGVFPVRVPSLLRSLQFSSSFQPTNRLAVSSLRWRGWSRALTRRTRSLLPTSRSYHFCSLTQRLPPKTPFACTESRRLYWRHTPLRLGTSCGSLVVWSWCWLIWMHGLRHAAQPGKMHRHSSAASSAHLTASPHQTI